MLEIPYLPPPLPRSLTPGRFVAAGVILILLAAVSGCLTGMIPMTYSMQQRYARTTPQVIQMPAGKPPIVIPAQQAMPLSQAVAGAVMYLAAAVVLGWLGVGAFLKHRYVRPLLLIFSTHGMIVGACAIVMIVAFLPMMLEQIHNNAAAGPQQAAAIIGVTVAIGMMTVFFIGVPTTLFFLMKSDAVRVTAEHFDLRRRWTDGLPLKLLGLVVTLFVFALFELMAVFRPRLPLFNTVLSGPPVIVLILLHAALVAWSAVLVYRRRLLGWRLALWGLAVPMVLLTVSTGMLPSANYIEMVSAQHESAEMIRQHEALFRLFSICLSAAFLIAFVVYMLRIRPLVEPAFAEVAPAEPPLQ